MPRLKRKPQSPRSDDKPMDEVLRESMGRKQKYSPDSTTKDPLDTHPSDDDYNPYSDDITGTVLTYGFRIYHARLW